MKKGGKGREVRGERTGGERDYLFLEIMNGVLSLCDRLLALLQLERQGLDLILEVRDVHVRHGACSPTMIAPTTITPTINN